MPTGIFARGSLKTRVTLFTLAIFLIGLWSLAFYASRILREDTQGMLGEQQFALVSSAAAQIDRELEERIGALEIAATRLGAAVPRRTGDLQTRLEHDALLARYFNGGIVVLGADGKALAAVPLAARQVGRDYLEVDAVFAALREGKSTIGAARLDRESATPVFAMAVPIRDSSGRVTGALMGVTRLGAANFLQTIADSRYGMTGGYVLIERQARRIIAASDKGRILEELPGPGVHPLIDRFIEGYQGSAVLVNPLGVEVLASVKGLAAAGWILSATLPTEEAFAPVRDVLRRTLIATLFLTLLAGGLTWWMLSRQFAPILAAAKALAAQWDTKQLPQPLPVGSQDEIGQLIVGFNRLLETLRQREVLLTQILDTSSVAIFLVDREGRITQANQRMVEMFGWPLDKLIGNEYVALIHPEERESGRQKMLALLASAIPAVDLDRLYWRADRSEFWGHLTGRRFYDANGDARGLVGVIADISVRKSVEEKLRQQNEMLSAVIENFPGAISLFDADLRLAAHNTQFRRLLDFPDTLFDKPDVNFTDVIRFNAERGEYGPGDPERQVAEIVDRARDFQPHRMERIRADGTVLEIRGMPMPGGGFVSIYIDITERKEMEDQVRQLAFHDELTHLPNRRLLSDRLAHTMAVNQRSACHGALMFIDLDNFKPLNDSHGHEFGDLLLIEVAHRLGASVRAMDTVARFGGDEFVVIISELDVDATESIAEAGQIAEKLRAALSLPYELKATHEGQQEVTVEHRCTASIGVALFLNHQSSREEILQHADAAMYQAKQAGRNAIRFYAGPAQAL